jgi:hypothetical protein
LRRSQKGKGRVREISGWNERLLSGDIDIGQLKEELERNLRGKYTM